MRPSHGFLLHDPVPHVYTMHVLARNEDVLDQLIPFLKPDIKIRTEMIHHRNTQTKHSTSVGFTSCPIVAILLSVMI